MTMICQRLCLVFCALLFLGGPVWGAELDSGAQMLKAIDKAADATCIRVTNVRTTLYVYAVGDCVLTVGLLEQDAEISLKGKREKSTLKLRDVLDQQGGIAIQACALLRSNMSIGDFERILGPTAKDSGSGGVVYSFKTNSGKLVHVVPGSPQVGDGASVTIDSVAGAKESVRILKPCIDVSILVSFVIHH